jgi:integrase
MAVGKITIRSVEAIPLPMVGKRAYLWDDTLRGFGVMVTPHGSRSYLVQYQMGGRGAPTKRITIGRHGSPWAPEKARSRASDILELIRKGIDPAESARKQREAEAESAKDSLRLAFDAYADLFGTKYIDGKALRSGEDIKSVFRRDLVPAFKSRPITSIRRSEIADCLDTVAERSMSAAVKAHKWLRKLFLWAVDRGDIAASPMDGMSPPGKDGQRTRVLAGDELRAVWAAADAMPEPYASFVKSLMLTGQRLREVAGMQWAEVDLDKAQWIIPVARTKNGRDHLVPLAPSMVALLAGRFPKKESRKGPVFTTGGGKPLNGFSKPKAKLDLEVAAAIVRLDDLRLTTLQPWVFHDLRRSFSTGCQSLGFPIEHTEAAINHVSGKRGGLARVYQLWEYQPEKVAVMAAWDRHLSAVVAGGTSNVIPLVAAKI